ncbi:EthD family reductase [Aegicerativicinus sediminis]|uniref:EthD family reductase n=1 Tax=Aegicerativicinus sediminis TaxID=2893202 RepID=UPI001E60632B|nr:EthD family reductase [Aegicerativicinus sediminis]
MIKLTALYGHPTDENAFEEYYNNQHMALVDVLKGHEKMEFTKFLNAADGSRPEYYRLAEFWFKDVDALQSTLGSPEGQAIANDLANFATGGVTLLTGIID